MHKIILIIANLLSLYSIELFATPITNTNQNNLQGLHLDWLDTSISPAKNFFQFANGGWQKTHPIPPAYSKWDNFHALHEYNQQLIKKILESNANNAHAQPGSIEQKIGDFYYSGMDESSIDKIGIKPLEPEFDRIQHIKNISDLQTVITHLQMIGVDTLFQFGQMQDFKDSSKVIGVATQSGLGLPDRDYYLKNDKKFQQIRQAYAEHIKKIFELLGDSHKNAQAESQTVLAIETIIAKSSLPRITLRDPHAIYHPMSLDQLKKQTPNISWKKYFTDINHQKMVIAKYQQEY